MSQIFSTYLTWLIICLRPCGYGGSPEPGLIQTESVVRTRVDQVVLIVVGSSWI